ncbi:MAG: IclR family transcriptional regulator [Halobacteriales archaeon]
MTAPEGLSTVEKSLEIIQALDTHGTAGPTELADELGMHKSTAYTHLRTLSDHGYVVREEDGYSLSFRFLKHGGTARDDCEIYHRSRESIRSLAERTGEVANLGLMEDGRGVLVYRVKGDQAVSDNAPVGSYTHLHATAYGKAMLAELPEGEVEEIVASEGLPQRTENTIGDEAELFERLDAIRERGYAVDREETSPGLYCVGSAITGDDDRPVGGISVSGPASKLNDTAYLQELIDQIENEVNKIELEVMYG